MLKDRINSQYFKLPLISAIILISASCRQNYLTDEGETWGTYYKVVYRADSPLTDSITDELRSIDEEFSLFNPNSAVSRINAGLTDTVSPRFVEVFELCKDINIVSGGMYDITVGSVANLWGFGKKKVNVRPTEAQIDTAMLSVGLTECSIVDRCKVVRKSENTNFDFSSVAKGYGIDKIADMLMRNGCHDFMIEIGGEIEVCGLNPKGKAWVIQVDSPTSGFGHVAMTTVAMGPERTALASSGNYRNFINLNDTVYGHTISPLTGYPIRGNILSATIMADNCALADAMATACMAVGDINKARTLVEKVGLKALIVYRDSIDEVSTFNNGLISR